MPQDWDRILERLKEEGRDIAAIDADLREICRIRESSKLDTGKYLMPEDLRWCRKHAQFSERDLLKWFRRFREKCPRGALDVATFKELFSISFPVADLDLVAEIVYEVCDQGKTGRLDFTVCRH